MNQESVPTNENSAAASASVPEDRALDALVTGKRAFRRLSDALIENHIRDFPERAEEFVDSFAQELAQDLERYLCSCPPALRIMLAGEVFRSLLFESMMHNCPWEAEPLVPMTRPATGR